jgi:ribosomal protein S18 acetylase RimI-like enzyme
MSIFFRPYADETDYQRMRALLCTMYALNGPPSYCTLGDLDWWRFTNDDPDAVHLAQLWLHNDDVVAIAWPGGEQVDLMAHPQHRALEDTLLDWAEGQRRWSAAESNEPVEIVAWGYSGDHDRTAVLQGRGYKRTGDYLSFKTRSLGEPVPEPLLPPGFDLRHVQGEADLEQRVAVHRAAFAPSRMSVAKHRAVMHAPTYRPKLDLVVVAPDTTFAAFCIIWFDEANRMGIFEPVGCHPDFQRRGLTKALLYAGLRRLQALGATMACVNSWHNEVAANKLYQSVGFSELDRNYKWVKLLEPGP